MPEMPEVEGLRVFLSDHLVGRTITRAELAAFSALKTHLIPLSALPGLDVERVERRGKFLAIPLTPVARRAGSPPRPALAGRRRRRHRLARRARARGRRALARRAGRRRGRGIGIA